MTLGSVPRFTSAMQPATSDAAICAGVGFIVFLVLGMALLLRSLNLQVGHKPTPTGNPDQHVVLGCAAILVFLVAVVLVLTSNGKL